MLLKYMVRIKLIDRWFLSVYKEQRTCFKPLFIPQNSSNSVTDFTFSETLNRNISSTISKKENSNFHTSYIPPENKLQLILNSNISPEDNV